MKPLPPTIEELKLSLKVAGVYQFILLWEHHGLLWADIIRFRDDRFEYYDQTKDSYYPVALYASRYPYLSGDAKYISIEDFRNEQSSK